MLAIKTAYISHADEGDNNKLTKSEVLAKHRSEIREIQEQVQGGIPEEMFREQWAIIQEELKTASR